MPQQHDNPIEKYFKELQGKGQLDFQEFNQQQILDLVPDLDKGGVCHGLCIEYSRYITKHIINNKKATNDFNFIKKINNKINQIQSTEDSPKDTREMLDKNLEYIGFFNRVHGYQEYQKLEDFDILQDELLEKGNYSTIAGQLLTQDSHIFGVALTGAEGGHRIVFSKINDNQYEIFDPNLGIISGLSPDMFNELMNKIQDYYNDNLGELKQITTSNFSQYIKTHNLIPDIKKTSGPTEDKSEKPRFTSKYLEQKKVSQATLLTLAIKGTIDDIEQFLDKHNDIDLNYKEKNGCTPLHYASLNQSTEICKFLIEKGADVNVKDSEKDTPLHYAITKGNLEIAKLLIEKGADVNATDSEECTPLHYAADKNNFDLALLLIENGATIDKNWANNLKDQNGDYLLHYSVGTNNIELTKRLIENGADVNAKNPSGETILHYASYAGDIDIINILIQKGADVNTATPEGQKPIDCAKEAKNQKIVELLNNSESIAETLQESPTSNSITQKPSVSYNNTDHYNKKSIAGISR